MDGTANWLQNSVDEFARTVVASVLKAFEKSEATNQIVEQHARTQRLELFARKFLETASKEGK
jgi:hypothetical protein